MHVAQHQCPRLDALRISATIQLCFPVRGQRQSHLMPNIAMTTRRSSALNVVWEDGLAGTFLGLIVGGCNYLVLRLTFGMYPPITLSVLFLGISGTIAGALQGAFVRPYARPRLTWLVVSSLGWMIAGTSMEFFAQWTRRNDGLWMHLFEPVLWLLGGMLGCGIISLGQWLLLRPYLRSAWWWLIMSILLGAGAGGVVFLVQPISAP
jgi:hypothetical protein